MVYAHLVTFYNFGSLSEKESEQSLVKRDDGLTRRDTVFTYIFIGKCLFRVIPLR
jgi:hypothetical protein